MKIFKHMKMSIFTKLTLTFLSVLLPFYGMTLFLNQKGSQSISSEITKSVKSRDAFYMQTLEQEIKRISQLFYEFVVDKDLMLIGISENLHTADLQDKVKAMQKRLQMVKASSVYVEKPMIYFPLMNRMMTPSDMPDYDKLQNQDEVDRLSRNVDPSRLIQLKDGRLFMSLRYPMNTNFERTPLFVVMMELSTVQLQDSLRNVVSPEQGNSLLVHTTENWMLSTVQDQVLLEDLKALSEAERPKDVLSGAGSVKLDKTKYWESYIKSVPLNLTLFVYIPDEKVLGVLRSYEKWVWVMLIVSIAIILLFALTLYRIIHNPMRKLVSAFRRVEQGRFMPVTEKATRDEFHYLFAGFNRMVSQLNILIHEVYEKEIRSQRSELKRLQAQINPHFLYNCFFIMGGLITDKEYGKAYGFVHYLRDYYRFITRNAEDHIPLEEEMQHAQTYIDIQTICYGDRIDVELEPLPKDLESLVVPRLIIQPLIENAYKYALSCHASQGELWIHYKMEGAWMYMMVEDNGTKLDDAQIAALSAQLVAATSRWEESTGIINVHRRLQIMFGLGCGLTLSRSQLGGLCARIAIKQQDELEEAPCTE
ncbi:sensor histidine kinase [Paenibacillus eucommiae]|uniref:Two-component system sensor histidine kinase YesM n=1 Tax=Paenibacillus eucommiae TaxID=1355755 RepID=A0ABS4ISB1_9BACL|nr:histidine kinase [Paenibacillus eucommiae]MBP1990467.1 two-component system sensor histidine kinase YesM [Paenibacillus eucommiae]